MKKKYFIFRPGTLGDQIVLKNSLDAFIPNISKDDLILIERDHGFGRVSAKNYLDYFSIFSQVLVYQNLFQLIVLLVKVRIKYRRGILIYLPHSNKSIFRMVIDLLLFSLAFDINLRGVLLFYKHRWSSQRVVNEYERIMEILEITFKLNNKVEWSVDSYDNNVSLRARNKITICPFSAWPSKNWGSSNFKELIKLLCEQGNSIELIGSSNDDLEKCIPEIYTHLVNVHKGESLQFIIQLMRDSALFVGVDSAPSHIAASLKIPSVILFSDTNRREEWKPLALNVIAIRNYVVCGGCFSYNCPITQHDCMKLISVNRVLEACNYWKNK
jgi:hypothetical protein